MSELETVSTEQARSAARRAAEILAEDPRIELVYLFGSSQWSPGERVGDLDLAVWARPALSPAERLALRSRLVEELQLPVDLVSLDDAPIVLRHEVIESGRSLFARDPDREVELVTRTRARYWDFLHYFRQQQEAAERRSRRRLRDSET